MLNFVTISNYALIESATAEFHPGFNVITGESGAGKSIFKGAVELLLGGRVDRSVIRTGCDRCILAGPVIENDAFVRCHLSENHLFTGFDLDDMRRKTSAEPVSREI